MGSKTGEEYINRIKSRKPEVWLGGRVVEDIYNEPIFKQPIQEIAKCMTFNMIRNIKTKSLTFAKKPENV